MELNVFVLYLNAVNVIKDGAFMKEENNKQIAVAKETCEMAFKFWKHYDDLFHAQQVSTAKNYLWLAVTELTALFAFNERLASISSDGTLFLACIFYGISITSSAVVVLCGITCLSEMWGYGKPVPQPYSELLWLIKDSRTFGSNSKERLNDLSNFCHFFDESIFNTMKQIDKRAHRLRFMGLCIMLAVFLGLLFLILTI